jgi:hypothetical protein
MLIAGPGPSGEIAQALKPNFLRTFLRRKLAISSCFLLLVDEEGSEMVLVGLFGLAKFPHGQWRTGCETSKLAEIDCKIIN